MCSVRTVQCKDYAVWGLCKVRVADALQRIDQ